MPLFLPRRWTGNEFLGYKTLARGLRCLGTGLFESDERDDVCVKIEGKMFNVTDKASRTGVKPTVSHAR